ncbi:hypothetical protein MAR_011927 [Mya arenaria]|uniref:Uncharacterized protein n=1 Tax=Mya arenaria TaxID=6604 RepID=A0ABY7FVG6_MYAAR|nr:hypothetical protein MAR_011927 [Mya arenaria]
MDDNQDEDVIFEGSPLYDSLMKTGSLAEELYFVEKHHKKNLTYGDEEVSPQKKPRSVWMKAVSLFHLLRLFVSPKVFDIKSNCQKGLVTVLKTSPLLQEDDADFLHCYIRNFEELFSTIPVFFHIPTHVSTKRPLDNFLDSPYIIFSRRDLFNNPHH